MPSSDPARPPIWTSGFICHMLLRETGNFISAVRISEAYITAPLIVPHIGDDGENVTYPDGSVGMFEIYPPAKFAIVLRFACEIAATFDVSVKMVRPDGTTFESFPSFPGSTLDGGASGRTITINANVPGVDRGTYWFDVYVDEELKLRIPLRILERSEVAALATIDTQA